MRSENQKMHDLKYDVMRWRHLLMYTRGRLHAQPRVRKLFRNCQYLCAIVGVCLLLRSFLVTLGAYCKS